MLKNVYYKTNRNGMCIFQVDRRKRKIKRRVLEKEKEVKVWLIVKKEIRVEMRLNISSTKINVTVIIC